MIVTSASKFYVRFREDMPETEMTYSAYRGCEYAKCLAARWMELAGG